MQGRAKIAAAFIGGILAALAAVGIVSLVDGGGSNGTPASTDSVQATQTVAPTEDDSDSQVIAVSGDCETAADIYEEVRPSVVQVDVAGQRNDGFFGAQPFEGTGTGIVLDDQGHILTNNHVVSGASTVSVRFDDGDSVPATIVGTDPANDLAVIKVDPADHDLTPATLGDSDDLRVGDPVLAIGNPFNLEGTLTQGIVSALDRTYSAGTSTRPIRGMIQTDAAVNPGNSGGPLLNCRGEVVGINTLIENPTGDSVNVGVAFAVPINTAKNELSALKAGQEIEFAWLGIAGLDLTPALADNLGLSVDEGVYVTLVTNGSPADEAGLVPAFANEQQAAGASDPIPGGDVITAADGEPVTGIDELANYIAENKKPGDAITLDIVRDGRELTVEATLADWPNA